jgi:uncharacterized protein
MKESQMLWRKERKETQMTTLELPPDLIPANSVLYAFRGSISHNLYKPGSTPYGIDDVDLVSIYIAPVEFYIGLDESKDYKRGRHIFHNEFDLVKYELKHFVRLALRFNPNIIPLLWLKPKHYLDVSGVGETLLLNRDLFNSKKAYKAFTGYAKDQLEEMENKKVFQGYMGEKRKKIVREFGYDCINASHAVRLLKMCLEFLETEKLNVYRENDRQLLLDIKSGEWGINRILTYSAHLLSRTEDAYKKSKLPEEPDYERANSIFMDIISDYVYEEYHMPMALKRY